MYPNQGFDVVLDEDLVNLGNQINDCAFFKSSLSASDLSLTHTLAPLAQT